MDQLNAREQQEFQQLVERKQMKDFMRVCKNNTPWNLVFFANL
jgi:import inner membrane translocase subunit TIM9